MAAARGPRRAAAPARRGAPPWALVATVVAAASAAAGCGLTGESRFAGVRIADGVAPWQDLGQPQFCASARLVGPPDGVPTGFCVDGQAVAGAACAGDDECRSRERCLCGHCAVQYCDSAAQCGAGRTCSFAEHRCHRPCATVADCAGGEDLCDRGECKQRCAASGDCQAGEICSASSGYCVAADCGADGDCQTGQHCVIQREPWDLRAPAALADPEPLLFVEARQGDATWRIWRATSADGFAFTFAPAAAVLEPAADEAGRVGAPTVLRTAAGYALYFEYGDGAGVRRATSTDGLSFTRDPEAPVLLPDAAWEEGRVRAPAVVALPDGTVALFYEGGDGAGVGLATSGDGVVFAKRPAPVLTPAAVADPVLWRDVTRVGQPAARLTRDAAGTAVVALYFAAFGLESAAGQELDQVKPIPPNYSIGYAAAYAADLELVPYPMNPVFDRAVEFLTHGSELQPTVLPVGDELLLYFGRADAAGATFDNVGVAVCPPRQ